MASEMIEIAFDAGRNSGAYDSAYVTEDLEEGLKGQTGSKVVYTPHCAWRHGYIVGFFSSHELHEVLNSDHLDLLLEAIAFAKRHGLDHMRDEE